MVSTFEKPDLDTLTCPGTIPVRAARPRLMIFCLVMTDCAALGLAIALSLVIKALSGTEVELAPYLALWPFLLIFLSAYVVVGLYSQLALPPPEEIRRCTLCSTLMFILLSTATYSLRQSNTLLPLALCSSILLSVVFVPLFRALARNLFRRFPWWGFPAYIFAPLESARTVIEGIRAHPSLGLRPVAVLTEEAGPEQAVHGVPVFSRAIVLPEPSSRGIAYAISTPDSPKGSASLLGRHSNRFTHLLDITCLLPYSSNLFVNATAVGNLLGVEVCQRALLPSNQLTKRLLDLALTFLLAIPLLPLIAVIALLVCLDSRGPIFYGQSRVGRGRKRFRAWKFRSMVMNAETVLQEHLNRDPLLAAEWRRDHKLKNDPRVTRVGRFLRKTSLDELPQLWNVLCGEMSLIGPRPIVDAEIARYGTNLESYLAVPGGITGLWQVSGRNNTTYQERVHLDEYYFRNWSVWLDLYILFRTISVVISREGAY